MRGCLVHCNSCIAVFSNICISSQLPVGGVCTDCFRGVASLCFKAFKSSVFRPALRADEFKIPFLILLHVCFLCDKLRVKLKGGYGFISHYSGPEVPLGGRKGPNHKTAFINET